MSTRHEGYDSTDGVSIIPRKGKVSLRTYLDGLMDAQNSKTFANGRKLNMDESTTSTDPTQTGDPLATLGASTRPRRAKAAASYTKFFDDGDKDGTDDRPKRLTKTGRLRKAQLPAYQKNIDSSRLLQLPPELR